MSGILEKFFQMAFILTIMILFINLFILYFGVSMTGDEFFVDVEGIKDANTVLTGAPVSQGETGVWQQALSIVVPTTNSADWDNIWNQFTTLHSGFSQVLEKIFKDIDPETVGDPAEGIGFMLVAMITIIQLAGAAYIPWALLSAWKGGGSP